jgi:predicted metal-dependent phosphoesterase TrpH
MPARQPFTALCQAAARHSHAGRADLHLHTTHSDGTYTPAQVVDLARRSGLAAIALTDHDTLCGIPSAQTAAAGSALEIVPGVELSAEYHGREFHLLGYFIRLKDAALTEALHKLCAERTARFWQMVERLGRTGVRLDAERFQPYIASGALGRRHLAEVLILAGQAGSVREAFQRYLGDGGPVALPKYRLPVREAIVLVRGAGGVASWAHPAYDCNRDSLAELRNWGLGALEAVYPAYGAGQVQELRARAAEFGLAITGGSDCHGPELPSRAVGTCSITAGELDCLRQLTQR